MGDRYGASDLESVLGNHGCRPWSPTGHYTSWYGEAGASPHVIVGCRQEVGPGR